MATCMIDQTLHVSSKDLISSDHTVVHRAEKKNEVETETERTRRTKWTRDGGWSEVRLRRLCSDSDVLDEREPRSAICRVRLVQSGWIRRHVHLVRVCYRVCLGKSEAWKVLLKVLLQKNLYSKRKRIDWNVTQI